MTDAARSRGPSRTGHVTLGDVARHVGVSAQSVSNALNSPTGSRPATRDRILAAVHELGYRPNRSARALRNQRSRLIGVKVEASRDDRAALLLDQFLHALAESAGAAGCHLILCHADDEAARSRRTASCSRPPPSTPSCSPAPTPTTPGSRRCASWTCRSRPSAGRGTATEELGLGRRRRPGRHPRRHRARGRAGAPPDRAPRLARSTPRPVATAAGWRRGAAPTLGLEPRPARRGARRLRRRPRRRAPAARRGRPGHRDRLLLRHRSPSARSAPWPTAACAPAPTSRSPASTTPPPPRSPRRA